MLANINKNLRRTKHTHTQTVENKKPFVHDYFDCIWKTCACGTLAACSTIDGMDVFPHFLYGMDIFCMYVFYNYVRFSVWYVLYGTPVRVWSFFNICMIVWTFDFSFAAHISFLHAIPKTPTTRGPPPTHGCGTHGTIRHLNLVLGRGAPLLPFHLIVWTCSTHHTKNSHHTFLKAVNKKIGSQKSRFFNYMDVSVLF